MGTCVSMPERRIVLLGRTGDGKSSARNTILGEKVFTPRASDGSVKAQCEKRKTRRYGRKTTVFETPGFFDAACDDEDMKSEIVDFLIECAQGVDAFVIVLKVEHYTNQEMELLLQRLNSLKGDVFEHTVILFTFGEQLEGKTIEEFIKANSQLQELVDKCGGRYHVIDSKYWTKRKRGNKSNRVQVKNLLETIDKMRNENGCFTNELLQELERKIQEEIGNMDEDNASSEEKREKAKKNVQNKMLEQIAGATTGALIGAFLGAGFAVCFIHLALLNVASGVLKAVGGGVRGAETAETAAEEAGGSEAETVDKAGDARGAAVEAGRTVAGAAVTGGVGTAVLGVVALAGAAGGGVTGWKAAEEADSVYDAMIKAAKLNCENATAVVENIHKYVANAFSMRQTK